MARIRITFDTVEGHTKKIAERMAAVCRDAGHTVETVPLASLDPEHPAEGFSHFILGASLHVGKHTPRAVSFMKKAAAQLDGTCTAFFSVSLSAAGTAAQQADAWRCLEAFLHDTGWTPDKKAIIAGALPYREYSFLKRQLMKRVVAKAGGDTDTSKNYVYTDWEKVDAFALEVAGTAS